MKDELVVGGFTAVDIRYDRHPWEPEDMERINAQWIEMIREHHRRYSGSPSHECPELYNGPVLRVSDYKLSGTTLHIDAHPTEYSHHAVTRKEKDLKKRANPLHTHLLARTTGDNGFLIFGRHTICEQDGFVSSVSGYVEPYRDTVQRKVGPLEFPKRVDPWATVLREAQSEINIMKNELTGRPLCLVVDEDEHHPSIVYLGNAGVTGEEIRIRMDMFGSMEFSEPVFVPDDAAAIKTALGDTDFNGRTKLALQYYLEHFDEFYRISD